MALAVAQFSEWESVVTAIRKLFDQIIEQLIRTIGGKFVSWLFSVQTIGFVKELVSTDNLAFKQAILESQTCILVVCSCDSDAYL